MCKKRYVIAFYEFVNYSVSQSRVIVLLSFWLIPQEYIAFQREFLFSLSVSFFFVCIFVFMIMILIYFSVSLNVLRLFVSFLICQLLHSYGRFVLVLSDLSRNSIEKYLEVALHLLIIHRRTS